MTKTKSLPLSGYKLEKVYFNELRLEDKEKPPAGEEGGNISVGWDWRVVEPEVFEVRLVVEIGPSRERDELVRASAVGRFRQTSGSPSVALADFVQLQGPAILFPFVRQQVAGLTGSGYYGPNYLPSINVATLMRDFDPKISRGAQQLRQSGDPKGSELLAPSAKILTGGEPRLASRKTRSTPPAGAPKSRQRASQRSGHPSKQG